MRLATLQKTSSYVCFYGSPRHNSSTHTPPSSSSLVEWAGPLLFFPFDSRARERLSTREEAVVATNLREHKVFANTSPLTLANARAVEDICPGLCTPVSLPPSFAPILSHEQKGGKKEGEKKRQRGSEIKRWRERENSESGTQPLVHGKKTSTRVVGWLKGFIPRRLSKLSENRSVSAGAGAGAAGKHARRRDTHVSLKNKFSQLFRSVSRSI